MLDRAYNKFACFIISRIQTRIGNRMKKNVPVAAVLAVYGKMT